MPPGFVNIYVVNQKVLVCSILSLVIDFIPTSAVASVWLYYHLGIV